MQEQSKTVKQLNKEISAYLHRYFVTRGCKKSCVYGKQDFLI